MNELLNKSEFLSALQSGALGLTIGAIFAFGIFTLLLSFIGVIIIKKSHQNLPFYFLSAILIFFSYYSIHLRMYINLLFAFIKSRC